MQSIENLIYWRNLQQTQEVLKLLQVEIVQNKDRILNGTLVTSPDLERKYCQTVGYIAGLKFLEDLLKDEATDYDD